MHLIKCLKMHEMFFGSILSNIWIKAFKVFNLCYSTFGHVDVPFYSKCILVADNNNANLYRYIGHEKNILSNLNTACPSSIESFPALSYTFMLEVNAAKFLRWKPKWKCKWVHTVKIIPEEKKFWNCFKVGHCKMCDSFSEMDHCQMSLSACC